MAVQNPKGQTSNHLLVLPAMQPFEDLISRARKDVSLQIQPQAIPKVGTHISYARTAVEMELIKSAISASTKNTAFFPMRYHLDRVRTYAPAEIMIDQKPLIHSLRRKN